MPSPQKSKGSGWERAVSQFLSETLGGHFMRSPGSGAYVGGQNQQRKQVMSTESVRVFKGDVIPSEGYEHLNIECKFYKDFAFHQLIQGEPIKQLEAWLAQSLEVADAQDITLIIMKFNRCGSYILAPNNIAWVLPQGSVNYRSPKHGSWWFCDFEKFIPLNKAVLQQKK